MLIFMDGFDYDDITSIGTHGRWSLLASNPIFSTGRFDTGQCMNINYSRTIIKKVIPDTSSGILSFAVKFTNINNGANRIFSFYDGATLQCGLDISNGGALVFRDGSNNTLGSSSMTMSLNTWYYLEVKFKITDTLSAGDIIVKSEGITILNISSGSTKTTSNSYANNIQFGETATFYGVAALYDDMVFMDLTGSEFNDFIGPARIVSVMPTGNGATNQWTNSNGNQTNNYTYVDDISTADYVESGNVGDIDLYNFGDLPENTTTVIAVASNVVARKTDVSPRNIKCVTRIGSTNYESADVVLLDTFSHFQTIQAKKPSDNTNWNKADFDGVQFGVKVST